MANAAMVMRMERQPLGRVLSGQYFVVFLAIMMCALAVTGNAAIIISSSSMATTDTVVNFDDLGFVFGTEIRNQYAANGVIFGGPSYLGDNVINPNLVRYIPNSSQPNALQVIPGASTSGLDIEFSGPVTEFGFDYEVSLFANLIISAYGSDHRLIETETFTATSGFAGLRESSDISSVEISSLDLRFGDPDSINFGIDNFEFTAVPEPSAVALALVGGLLLSLLRQIRIAHCRAKLAQNIRLSLASLSNQAIASRLFVSDHTVHRHLANILNKLNVSTRAAAVAQAARRGLLG